MDTKPEHPHLRNSHGRGAIATGDEVTNLRMDEQKTLSAQQSTESAQMMGTNRFLIGAHRVFNPEEGT
ncbi:hypothetical protein T4A_5349 [Trichinella pseudospiralis]|uniref:Uncharacterized protein n=1 Tax=Trichinella pseudospiralis TaxID=6337 RepID=A0A0V1DVY3_TRIPS|nr:hypothetical protein T4A_5349 [Trichinella pseudospiralis]